MGAFGAAAGDRHGPEMASPEMASPASLEVAKSNRAFCFNRRCAILH
jgi:hypothetical protein